MYAVLIWFGLGWIQVIPQLEARDHIATPASLQHTNMSMIGARHCPCSRCIRLNTPWQMARTIKRHLARDAETRVAQLQVQVVVLQPDYTLQGSPTISYESYLPLIQERSLKNEAVGVECLAGQGCDSGDELSVSSHLGLDVQECAMEDFDDNSSVSDTVDEQPPFPFNLDDPAPSWDERLPCPFALDDLETLVVPESRSNTPDLAMNDHNEEELGSEDSASENSDSDSDAPDISHDPAFIPQEHLFPFQDPDDDDAQDPNPAPATSMPPVFSEHPIVQQAYICAFIAGAFRGATHALVQGMLLSSKSTIASFIALDPTLVDIDLNDFATTYPTLERRLGVNTSSYIKYFFVCDLCWMRHKPEALYTLKSSKCTHDDCSGNLYTTKRVGNGKNTKEQCIPCKILPYSMLIHAIQCILLRPGKWSDFQHWRGPQDQPGRIPPHSLEDWEASWDPCLPMNDVYDGYAWRAVIAGLERRRGGRWGMEDIFPHNIAQQFVSLPCGLLLAFNIDWYVPYFMLYLHSGFVSLIMSRFQTIKGSIHSTGAMYATIINNPRAIRFLCEETILICVVPGPREPSLEQLNYILEPFVQDVHILYGGERVMLHLSFFTYPL